MGPTQVVKVIQESGCVLQKKRIKIYPRKAFPNYIPALLTCPTKRKKKLLRAGFAPASYGRSDSLLVHSQLHTVESCDLSFSMPLFRSGLAPVGQDFHMLTTAPCYPVDVQGA